jgi:hypothetical protein
MRRHHTCVIAAVAFLSIVSALPTFAQDAPTPYQDVLSFLDKPGDFKDNVLKVNIPRNDVTVTVANVATHGSRPQGEARPGPDRTWVQTRVSPERRTARRGAPA